VTARERAEAVGLRRYESGYRHHRIGWGRPESDVYVVGRADAGFWWAAPEEWGFRKVVAQAPRFATEDEALEHALLLRDVWLS
jgi:hypothetical protein